MQPVIQDAPKKSFVRSAFLLMGGTIFCQALTIVASPMLTRIFDASAYGTAGLISTVAGSMAWAAGLRYELGIVLAKKKKTGNVLAFIILLFSSFVAIVTLVVLLCFGASINRLLGTEILGKWICLVPLFFYLTAFAQIQRMLAVRDQNFEIVTRSQLYTTVATVVLQFAAGLLLSASGFSLILSTLFGMIIGVVVLFWGKKSCFSMEHLSGRHYRKLVPAVLYKFRNLPLYTLPYSIVGMLTAFVLPLALSSYHGVNVVGYYYLAKRITNIPVTIIVGSLSQLFFRKATLEIGLPTLSSTIHRIHRLIIILLISPALLLTAIMPDLFQIMFGLKWREGGAMTSWYLFYSFATLLTAWIDRLYDVLGKQRTALKLQIVTEIITLSAVGVSVWWNANAVFIIAAYSIAVFICNIVWIYVTFRLARVSMAGYWKNLSLLTVALVASISLNLLVIGLNLQSWFVLALALLVFASLLGLNRKVLLDLRNSLRNGGESHNSLNA